MKGNNVIKENYGNRAKRKIITWLLVVLWTITGPAASLLYQQTGHQHQKHQQHEHSEAQQKKQDRDRWLWQLPQRVMNVIGVKPGKTIGEVGKKTFA